MKSGGSISNANNILIIMTENLSQSARSISTQTRLYYWPFINNEFSCHFDNKSRGTYLFILLIIMLFGDVMLLWQTVSCLTDQRIDNYPFSN